MRVLFVHQNFPGQYRHIAPALASQRGNEVVALTMGAESVPGIRTVRHVAQRASAPGVHPLARDFEAKVIRGESAALAAVSLKSKGFVPDIICGHPGWGETLFLKEVWPETPMLSFLEFVYKSHGADVGFDPEFPLNDEDRFRVRALNGSVFLSMEAADWLITPTTWQARQIPLVYRGRLSVIHDGIDTDVIRPNPNAMISLSRDKIVLRPGEEVITFVNRNLEPYRGYHTFIRALPEILRQRPRARAIVVGADRVSYGSRLPKGETYKAKYLAEVSSSLDMSRVHFVGSIPYSTFLNLLQISAAHVYLTYPFVLSWSMLEAMAAGCIVIGSATQPVKEVIRHGENGLLVDFFSPAELSAAVVDVLARPQAFLAMRHSARHTITSQYDLKRVCLPKHLALIDTVASKSHVISASLSAPDNTA